MNFPNDFLNKVINGDCLEILKQLPDNSIDSIVTDPPAGIGFMGKEWDTFNKVKSGYESNSPANENSDNPFFKTKGQPISESKKAKQNFINFIKEVMTECLRVLKPGGHALVWAIPRTSHWTANAIEDAGFEIRDIMSHCFGSGFPKSLNLGKKVDELQGNEREDLGLNENSRINKPDIDVYKAGIRAKESRLTKGNSEFEGWGTALKPAIEHWIMARKPISEKTVAENVLKWGVGGINIDECRVNLKEEKQPKGSGNRNGIGNTYELKNWISQNGGNETSSLGRFPANLILSYPENEYSLKDDITLEELKQLIEYLLNKDRNEILGLFPKTKSGQLNSTHKTGTTGISTIQPREKYMGEWGGDSGSASRFFTNCIEENEFQELPEEFQKMFKELPNVEKEEVEELFPESKSGGGIKGSNLNHKSEKLDFQVSRKYRPIGIGGDSGLASRFFYCAKCSKKERNFGLNGGNGSNTYNRKCLNCGKWERKQGLSDDYTCHCENPNWEIPSGNIHPTVKPIRLMQCLCKLITPNNGIVLDCFAGSGSTLIAARLEGFNFIGIEKEQEYIKIAERRLSKNNEEWQKLLKIKKNKKEITNIKPKKIKSNTPNFTQEELF